MPDKSIKKPEELPVSRIGDVVPNALFAYETVQIELGDILDKPIIVLDAVILEKESEFVKKTPTNPNGMSTFVVFAFSVPNDDTNLIYSTTCGGFVVVEKLSTVKTASKFPVYGKIVKNAKYYNFVDVETKPVAKDDFEMLSK